MRGTFSSARGRISLEPLESRQLLSVALPQVVAPATGPSGSAPSVSATPTPASVKGVGITFDAEATEPFNGLVGELLGLNSTKGVYANIDWGDGTSDTAGTFVPLPTASAVAGFGIEGQHTYAKAGTFAVSIIVTRQIGPPGSGTPIILVMKINSKAVVSADQEGGVTLFEPARQQFTATVGTFDYVPLPVANAINPVLSATIDWGGRENNGWGHRAYQRR